jgi:hypothetical protein
LARPVTVRSAGAVPSIIADDAGRQEGEGSEQADVPFALGPKLCDLGEGGNAAEPDVIDPSPSFGKRTEWGCQPVASIMVAMVAPCLPA